MNGHACILCGTSITGLMNFPGTLFSLDRACGIRGGWNGRGAPGSVCTHDSGEGGGLLLRHHARRCVLLKTAASCV